MPLICLFVPDPFPALPPQKHFPDSLAQDSGEEAWRGGWRRKAGTQLFAPSLLWAPVPAEWTFPQCSWLLLSSPGFSSGNTLSPLFIQL